MAHNWIDTERGNETRRQILAVISNLNEAGTAHRAAIARELGVTRKTAAKHVQMLIDSGEVREVDGRRQELANVRDAGRRPRGEQRVASRGSGGRAPVSTCDYCNAEVFIDRSGYYVGEDDSSDCPEDGRGHMVDGEIRER